MALYMFQDTLSGVRNLVKPLEGASTPRLTNWVTWLAETFRGFQLAMANHISSQAQQGTEEVVAWVLRS